jgi:RNA polymerase sigma-70 factor, ECF subfamily
VNDPDTAKDIVQHVMLKFWEKKEDIVIQTSLVSYLNRAVINTALNYIGKNKKVISLDTPEFNNDITTGTSLENKIEKKELQLLIRREIDKLPPKCKTVFSLSRFGEMSNKEIADHLNISVKAVEKHISKALKVLRVTLKPVWELNLLILMFLTWIFLV